MPVLRAFILNKRPSQLREPLHHNRPKEARSAVNKRAETARSPLSCFKYV
nr:MAG TPA: hypothetical protein [Caudoviricetes sp.]